MSITLTCDVPAVFDCVWMCQRCLLLQRLPLQVVLERLPARFAVVDTAAILRQIVVSPVTVSLRQCFRIDVCGSNTVADS